MAVHEPRHRTKDPCEGYRSQWNAASSGVLGVSEFIKQYGSLDLEARARLIQVDLEECWSHWAETAEKRVGQSVPVDELIDAWKQLPRFQNYAVLFADEEEFCRYLPQLAECEAICRDQWGDGVGSPYYEHYFKIKTTGLARRQRRHLRCEFERNEDYSQVLFPMRGRNEIGRQRRKDSEPYFCEVNPDGNRLVVANRYESVVSREQLTVQMLTPTAAIIFNRSGVNSVRIGTDIILPPGAKTCVLFPFTIQIPGRRLFCY